MDHFNSTVFNGAVVSTRRGFTVTKQKHKGLSFVNASVQDTGIRAKPQASNAFSILPPAATITFVANQGEGKKGTASQLKTTVSNKGVRSSPKSDISRRRPKAQPRRRSCSSSTSASTHSSAASDIVLSDPPDGGETDKERSPLSKSLPAWASYTRPKSALDFARRLTFMAYALAPRKSFALDELPLPGPEGSLKLPEELWLEKDPTSIHCATTLGVLYDTLVSGMQETKGLAKLTSQLRLVINRKLNAAEQNKTANSVTIHGVSALAIIAGYQGEHDQWQVHIKGLMRLLDLVGDQDKLDGRTINTIRKADMIGAISSATTPCIPFVRLHHELLVPPMVYDAAMIRVIQQHLQACALDRATVKTISDLALFNRYMDHLKTPGSSVKHDTQTVIEEYYFLQHQLLSLPKPLRNSDEVVSANVTSNFASSTHELPQSVPVDPTADPYSNSIETAARILSLLLIQDPTLDLPCESVLLHILHQQARTLLEYRRSQHRPSETWADPRLLLPQKSSIHPQTPTLLWICITGHLFSSLKAPAATEPSNRMQVYGELLISILGPEKAAHPELVSDEELELCRYLSLRHLKGENYGERGDIGRIVRSIKAE
ncbi:hypothetical protein PG991_007575 [Apiospora marii]|uniref:Wings apart-like protein C-terminal domain-containing protein n=1 Tax=Apiospora marii TaxID=335849 RepID=A0ABR1RTV3_9PEZI